MTLSGDQIAAIGHRGSHLQIIACVGSGKTEVMARRVAALIDEGTAWQPPIEAIPPPATMKLPAFLLALAILASGCTLTRAPLTPTERATRGFEENLLPAATDFHANIIQDYQTLTEQVDSAVSSLGPSLGELVEDLDSYKQRTISSQSDSAKIQAWLQNQLQSSVLPAVTEFYGAYGAEVADLQSRLLVHTELNPLIESHRQQSLDAVSTTALPATPQDLKGSATLKTLEDAATFVPIAGDAYDVFRSFIYDPRLASAKEKAGQCLPQLRDLLHRRLLDPLAKQLPTVDRVVAECRKNFSAQQALEMLAEERQIKTLK